MVLGVAMQRLCPDQTKTEAARKAYVDQALYDPPAPTKKSSKKSTPGQANKQARGGRTSER